MAVRRIPGRGQGAAGGGEETKVSGGRRRCQGRRPPLRAECSASVGRGGSENVTCGCRRRASAGPIPFTRCKPSSEPKGPSALRSATIRAASAGPIPGRRSSSAALATSRSRMSTLGAGAPAEGRVGEGAVGARDGVRDRPPGAADEGEVRGAGRRPPDAIAESTFAIWSASCARSAAGGPAGRIEAAPRTATPSAATAATNRRARCSAGVGTPNPWFGGLHEPYPFVAGLRVAFLIDPRCSVPTHLESTTALVVSR